jgi:hypothetical protein
LPLVLLLVVIQPSNKATRKGGNVMKILLAAVLATVIAAPCMAANENDGDKNDVLTPGVNEPLVPDTLKPNADQRIRNEGRANETEGRANAPARENRELKDNKIDDKK